MSKYGVEVRLDISEYPERGGRILWMGSVRPHLMMLELDLTLAKGDIVRVVPEKIINI